MEKRKNEKLADELMAELNLDFGEYKKEEIRSELIQCLPEILKLDVSLLQNEIKSVAEDISDLEQGREKEIVKSVTTIKRSYELLKNLHENDANIEQVSDPINLQLKQFSKAIERSKLSQMHSTADMASVLNDVSQDLQELIELPQNVLKAIKSQAFDTAIGLIAYFNLEIVPHLGNIAFVSFLKEEIDKLTDTLKDKIKECINLSVSSKSTLTCMGQLRALAPVFNDPLQVAEEYVKLRDSRFAIIFNKSLFSLVQKLPTDFTDFSAADQQNFHLAYIYSVEDLPEVLREVKELKEEWTKDVDEDSAWRVKKILEGWEEGHIRSFVAVAKNAIQITEEKYKGEIVSRVYAILEKLKKQDIELMHAIYDYCEEYVFNLAEELVKTAKDELVREIKKGIKQKQVDTQAIASDVPEEIHMSPTYLLFIGHTTNAAKRLSDLCEKLRVKEVNPILEKYLAAILEIGALYTEYLSDTEHWLMAKDDFRNESLLGFKTYCEIVVPFLLDKVGTLLKHPIPQEEKSRIRLQCIDWLSIFIEELT